MPIRDPMADTVRDAKPEVEPIPTDQYSEHDRHRGPTEETMSGVLAYPAFVRLWLADAISSLGSFTSALALQYIVIDTLAADQRALGLVRAAQWLPSLLVGMVVGVVVDRIRRRRAIVGADLLSAASLGSIAALAWSGRLTVGILVGLVFVVGVASVLFHAAHQSYVPSLVPLTVLPRAHARLDQTMTAAQSAGPLVAGVIVRFLSAPIAIAINSVTFAVSALIVGTIRDPEPHPKAAPDRRLWRELREGARWVYRHRMLAPYAVSLHVWFFFNSSVMTVFVFFAARDLSIDPLTVGLVLACAGLTGVLGAGLAPRLAERIGAGWLCIVADWIFAVAFVPVLLARPGVAGVALLMTSQLAYGLGLGLRGPVELSYRNAVTPDRLRARMNATIRSMNWGLIAVSAPLAGWFAVTAGNRAAIAISIGGLVLAALMLTCSRFRTAKLPDPDAEPAWS